MRTLRLALAVAACTIGGASYASPIIDGMYDDDYGAPTATVLYSANAPEHNFDAPTGLARAGYNIYLTSDANFVYGLIQATLAPQGIAGTFANLYFDLDPAAGNGSDLGFEIGATSIRAFAPGVSGYAAVSGASAAANGQNVEFRIANSAFTGPIAGLFYEPTQTFAKAGDQVVLRLSQSLSYSVAGGPTYGPNRLGTVTIGAGTSPAPEPASWLMMMAGFGLVGAALRRRRIAVSFA